MRTLSRVVNRHPIQRLLGERIVAARLLRKWTQEDLAKRVDRHQTTVGKWEDGDIEIGAISLVVLANVLGVTPNYLLGFEDNAAARALRSSTSFFIDHEAVGALQGATKRSEVQKFVDLRATIGAEVPANWTEVPEAEFRKLQQAAQGIVDSLGRLVIFWEPAAKDSAKGGRKPRSP